MRRIYLILALLTVVLLATGCAVDWPWSRSPTERLWTSLKRYEQWVVTNEDPDYGYIRDRGYPMYLYSFGRMYLGLYKHTQDKYYRDKFFRVVTYIDKIRNEDWTWTVYTQSRTSPLYNGQFSELFISAWELTYSDSYRQNAKDTVYALMEYFLRYKGNYKISYNGSFNAFVTIANYCSKFPRVESLVELGKSLYDYSLSGYDPDTGEWFYKPEEKEEEFYDGHAAFYQTWLMQLTLEFEEEIEAVYPEQHSQLIAYLPTMIEKVSQYLLPSGTFYASEEKPDNTESVGIVLLAYQLYDDFFGTNHQDIKDRAEKTILERQAPSGAYYKGSEPNVIEIWHGDEIPQCLPKYLHLVEKKR